jgi:hypothetical protein
VETHSPSGLANEKHVLDPLAADKSRKKYCFLDPRIERGNLCNLTSAGADSGRKAPSRQLLEPFSSFGQSFGIV